MNKREPTLDELLNEPMIRKVMAADGYSAEDIRLLMRQANARADAGGYQPRHATGARMHGSDTRPFPRGNLAHTSLRLSHPVLADRWEDCMPKIEIAAVPDRKGSGYPLPFDAPWAERVRQRLGNAGGLTDFGVNLMHLPPGNGRASATFARRRIRLCA